MITVKNINDTTFNVTSWVVRLRPSTVTLKRVSLIFLTVIIGASLFVHRPRGWKIKIANCFKYYRVISRKIWQFPVVKTLLWGCEFLK